jgi:hypothetical protein
MTTQLPAQIGLCTKVRTGTLTADEADTLFERAHGTVLQQRRETPPPPVPPAL